MLSNKMKELLDKVYETPNTMDLAVVVQTPDFEETFISDNLDNADVNVLLDKIGYNSYYTGLDVDEKYKMKYFEY